MIDKSAFWFKQVETAWRDRRGHNRLANKWIRHAIKKLRESRQSGSYFARVPCEDFTQEQSDKITAHWTAQARKYEMLRDEHASDTPEYQRHHKHAMAYHARLGRHQRRYGESRQ